MDDLPIIGTILITATVGTSGYPGKVYEEDFMAGTAVTKNIAINQASEKNQVGLNTGSPTTYYRPVKGAQNQDRVVNLEYFIDFATNIGFTNLGSAATGDVIGTINLPPNLLVKGAAVQVITKLNNAANTLTASCTVGDVANSATEFISSVTLTTVGATVSSALNVLYTSADSVNLTMTVGNGPVTSGQIRVMVWGRDVS